MTEIQMRKICCVDVEQIMSPSADAWTVCVNAHSLTHAIEIQVWNALYSCGAHCVPIGTCTDDLSPHTIPDTHNPWHSQSLSLAGAAVGQTLCNNTLQHTHCYTTGGRAETVSILRQVAFTHAHSHTLSLSQAAYSLINTLLSIHTWSILAVRADTVNILR